VLAAKQRTAEVFPLAALAASDDCGSLPQTRVWGLSPGNRTDISGSRWITSTLRWGCEQAYDGTASGRLVGLDYAQNRYYSSILGRFLSPDPSKSNALKDPGQWNKYAYAGGDPVNFSDPSGLMLGCPSGDWSNCGGGTTGTAGLFSGSDGGNKGPWNDPPGAKTVITPLQQAAATTAAMRQQATAAVAGLGPGCTKIFGGTNIQTTDNPMLEGGGSSVTILQALQATAGDTNFYYAFGAEGTLTLSQTGFVDPQTGQPFNPDQTIQSYMPSGAAAVSPGEGVIYLAQSFSSGTQAWQAAALVHELLHGIYGGASDAAVDSAFGISVPAGLTGEALVNAASNALQNWVQSDCGNGK